jgi:peptide/nickel transport system substrate-binding protein
VGNSAGNQDWKQYENVADIVAYQLNRRGVLKAGFAASAAAMLGGATLSACSGDGGTYSGNNKKPPAGEEEPLGKANIPTPRDKTLIIGQVDYQIFNSFNAKIPNGVQSGSGFDTMVREYLFYLNTPTGELIPWLADKYEYNADFTTLTFHFNPGVKWNDGKPFTAKDFKFTVELMRDNANLIGGGGDLAEFVKVVETPDDHTAVIQLKRPDPRFHYTFICNIATGFEVLPEHIWKGQDPTRVKDNPPVRTGPYMLDKTIPNQKMFVWKKNPDYWNKAKFDPAPEFVIFQSAATSQDAASQAFKRAEFDVGSLDEEHAKILRGQGYKYLITTPFHDPCPRGLWPNNDPSRGIISDPRMHWVVSYLVDREKIGKTVWPVETPPAQYPWADYDGNKKYENAAVAEKFKLEYSPEKAEALLDQMGAKKGSDGKRMWKGKPASVEIITPAPVDGAEYIIGKLVSDELKKIGVASTIRSYSGSVYTDKNQRGEFDVTSEWLCRASWDPNQLYSWLKTRYAQPVGKNAADKNIPRYRNAAMDKLTNQLDNLDPESPQAKPLMEQALTEYFETLPCIPVIQTAYPAYYNTAYWSGWPTEQDLYQVPNNWWGQFMFVIGKLKPTGRK